MHCALRWHSCKRWTSPSCRWTGSEDRCPAVRCSRATRRTDHTTAAKKARRCFCETMHGSSTAPSTRRTSVRPQHRVGRPGSSCTPEGSTGWGAPSLSHRCICAGERPMSSGGCLRWRWRGDVARRSRWCSAATSTATPRSSRPPASRRRSSPGGCAACRRRAVGRRICRGRPSTTYTCRRRSSREPPRSGRSRRWRGALGRCLPRSMMALTIRGCACS
mmetsp:Transcript_3071/g.11910  ORF Transcript_3071/g.11910 Transcript_3071/m.11910 type:complete len:219 (-) Transcript_3071:253-909(-)